MDAIYQSLARRILAKWDEHVKKHNLSHGDRSAGTSTASAPASSPDSAVSTPRLLIALGGPPGSGKTTIARHVVDLVNESPGNPPKTTAISADGFHLPLAALRALPNAAEALARRGAPWTFDGVGVVALVRSLRAAAAAGHQHHPQQQWQGRAAVLAPTFDHAVKDPVAGGMRVGADVDVCLLEGNYLLCGEEPWSGVADAVDDRWLVSVEEALARARVASRHVAAGIEPDLESALRRADGNDMVNGRFVMERSRGRYDLLIESVEVAEPED